MIYAIDFDGTLCVDRYPEIGEPREDMIRAVLDAQRAGDRFILWTCRIGERLEEAVAWSAARGITFDAVNDNLPDMIAPYGNNCRKVLVDGYIDDRNVRDIFWGGLRYERGSFLLKPRRLGNASRLFRGTQ